MKVMAKDLRSSYPARRDFERGTNLLKECIESGRIKFSMNSSETFDSLSKVRVRPHGRLNLDTVDELVRCTFHILASDRFKDFYETKE